MICSFQPKTYAGLAKHTARCYSQHLTKVHVYAADGLSSTITVYNHIKKDKNADLAIANSILDALDMCAKNDLIRRKSLLLTSTQTRLAGELATAESITAKDPNHVDTFSLDFAFSFANILLLITFIISYRLFADKLNIQQSLLDRATVVPIIILVNKTQLSLISGDVAAYTLLARFIPTTKIRNPLLKTTDTLHLLLKGLVIKMLDFMQDITEQKAIIQQLVAVVSPLFVLKAPFALHFIRVVCDLVTLAQYKSYDEDTLAYIQGALERMNVFKEEFQHALTHIIQDIRMYRALDSIYTRANSEAHHITIVKQFYSIINKKEYILQICLHNSQRTALLAANYATVVKQRIQPHSTKLPLSEVAANIAISNFTHAAAVFRRDYVWVQEFKHRDNRRQSRTVTDNRKHIAYIRAFSEILLFNNNRQINNTTEMLSVPFKFYNLSTIIRLVHLVLRDLPNSTTRTTMSYYVNNYID
ncbi:hypothetical protein HBI36_014490 [Parastagonospora nodorum]|nr:hypothetical protein HBI36_014490 [Parastagonospora nodorum]